LSIKINHQILLAAKGVPREQEEADLTAYKEAINTQTSSLPAKSLYIT
jgi:hypothetical protein